MDEATLAEMRKRGTYFVPTLAVMSSLGDPRGNSADDVALQPPPLRQRSTSPRVRAPS